jgi:hypothetical protein
MKAKQDVCARALKLKPKIYIFPSGSEDNLRTML